MINVQLTGDWKRIQKDLNLMEYQFHNLIAGFMHKELIRYQGMVSKGIRDQAPGGKQFRPISAWTLAMRKFRGFSGTKALIVSGEMRKSLTWKFDKSKLEGFAGILYTARSKSGKSMANIAEIHEFGTKPFAVKATPKMRRFLAMVAKRSGLISYTPNYRSKGVYIIKIPARPFLGPTFEEWQKGLSERVLLYFSNMIGK